MAAVTDLTSKSEMIDRRHMQRAIDLARQGEGHVEPNPMVGCVIAVWDEVIAEGFHRRYGGRHADEWTKELGFDRCSANLLLMD